MMSNCCHHVQAAPSHHRQQDFLSASALSRSGRHCTRVECRKREIASKKPRNVLDFGCSSKPAAGRLLPPWRIVGRPSFTGRHQRGGAAFARMLVIPNSSLSSWSRSVGKNWRREMPVDPILLNGVRRRRAQKSAAPAIKASDPGCETEEFVTTESELGVNQGRPGTAICSPQAPEMSVNPNSILSTSAKIAGKGPGLRNPADPTLLSCGGGEASIKANKSSIEGHNETILKSGYGGSGRGIMGRRAAMLLGGSTLWTSLGCCRSCEEAVAAQDWDYGGPCGPAKWEGLCTSGPKQSPIDILSSRTQGGASLGVLNFAYAPGSPSIKNTGHGTIQVSFPNAYNVLKVRGQTLQLLQFHFHAPSEHAFDGERYAMEAHLVHRDPVTRKLAVVGVMLDASKYAEPNKCLAASLTYVPQEHGLSVDAPIRLSPSFLLPPPRGKNGARGYVHYGGSLTTPPCSEDVEWFVLDTPLKISSSQVIDFMRFSGDGHSLAFNSRPLQPLGDRAVFKGP